MENDRSYGDYKWQPKDGEDPNGPEMKIDKSNAINLREKAIRVGENLGGKISGRYDDLGEWSPNSGEEE